MAIYTNEESGLVLPYEFVFQSIFLQMAFSKELFCGICEGRNKYLTAIQYCPECEDAFCGTCLEHHSIAKATKSHKLILADNYKNLPSFILEIKTFCNVHNEKYQNYCSHHQEPLCKKCIATTHNNCTEITILEDVLRNAKSSTGLGNAEISLEDSTRNIQNITTDREKNLKKLKEQRQDITKDVQRVFEILNKHLNGLQKDLLSRVNEEADKHEKLLEDFLQELQERGVKMGKLQENIGKMKMYASDLQSFLGMRKVEELVKGEEKYIDDISVKEFMKQISLLYSPAIEVNDIVSKISTFGVVSIKKEPSTVTLIKRSDQQAQMVAPQKPAGERMRRETPERHEGKTYRALYSYQASDENGLTINKGDILRITDDSRPDWWLGCKVDFKNDTNFDGFIPSNYVKKEDPLYSYAWYVGEMSRGERERLMSRPDATIGTYMYELSVLHAKGQIPVVYHYDIAETTSGFNIDHEHYQILQSDAQSLPELVDILSRFLNDKLRPALVVMFMADRKTLSKLSLVHHSCTASVVSEEVIKMMNMTRSTYFAILKKMRILVWEVLHFLVKGEGDASGLCQRLTKPCRQEMEDWEVSKDSLNLSEKLRDDNSNIMWKGKWNKAVPVTIVAVAYRANFLKQIDILKRCRHKNIVKMYGICKPSRYIITELVNRDLLTVLRESDQGFTFKELVQIAAQVADGMRYLESHSIVHINLKAGNILLTENQKAKIFNFQLSVAMDTDKYNQEEGGKYPIKWTAPEAALYLEFSVKSDVWSYGILLVELFTKGGIPYPGMSNREVLEKVEKGYRHQKPYICPDSMYDIMKKCWYKDPASRPTFEFLFNMMDYFVFTTEAFNEEIGRVYD